MISTTTIHIEKKKTQRRGRCSGCKSQYHNMRRCPDVFGWWAGFITEKEKKLNDLKHNILIELCDRVGKSFEEASARNLQYIEIMTNDYIIPYSSQNGNPPLLNYWDVYGSPYNMPSGRLTWIRSNESWIEHIQDVIKKSEIRLDNQYGKNYYEKIHDCNGFVDKLNFTIKKSKKFEKDTLHNVNAVSKKHHLPLEICKYIAEYVYTCPYEDGEEILYYEN